ncbi:MAG: UvrB/UvrC motif-containing protein [Akkermansiaceae bacterium]|nr:UvrB/UvrC motif-containing protein [Akkermansiaceae bacterium]
MKCDYCDSKATVFLTQLAEGQMKKVCLCEPCAKDKGVTDPTGFSMADMLLGGLVGKAMEGMPVVTGTKPRRCPSCGFTLDDLRRVRRFGCADCYQTFSEEVNNMLRSMHPGTSHVGKVPEGLVAKQVRSQRLEELQERLDEAIAAESYEEAAGIRDEIQNLSESKS